MGEAVETEEGHDSNIIHPQEQDGCKIQRKKPYGVFGRVEQQRQQRIEGRGTPKQISGDLEFPKATMGGRFLLLLTAARISKKPEVFRMDHQRNFRSQVCAVQQSEVALYSF